jgi:cell shape-determining protein MreC
MNREYAVVGRKKKSLKVNELELRVQQLEQENAQLRERLGHVEAENMSFRMVTCSIFPPDCHI